MTTDVPPSFLATPPRPSTPSPLPLPPSLTNQPTTNPPFLSHTADPDPQDYERHKQDSLAKQKKGQGHWKPELASVSEESVRADRTGPQETSEAAMKRLQEQTKGRAEETSKNRTSMRD
jgi:hypothetical protein